MAKLQSDLWKVISIKYGWNTIAWAKIMHLGHEVQNLLGVNIHTSCKISKYCQHFRDTKTHMGKIFGIWFFFYLKRQGYIDITRTKINFGGHIIFIHNLAMTFLIKLQNSKNNQNRANMKFYSASCFYPKSRGKNGTSLKAIFLKSKIHRSKPSSVL